MRSRISSRMLPQPIRRRALSDWCRSEASQRKINMANALQHRPNAESDQHFMVPQPLATLHGAKIAYQAVAAAAHAGEPAIFPCQHLASMHCGAIPSILTKSIPFCSRWNEQGVRFRLQTHLNKTKLSPAIARGAAAIFPAPASGRAGHQSADPVPWSPHQAACGSRSASAFSIWRRTDSAERPCRSSRRSSFHRRMISRSLLTSIAIPSVGHQCERNGNEFKPDSPKDSFPTEHAEGQSVGKP